MNNYLLKHLHLKQLLFKNLTKKTKVFKLEYILSIIIFITLKMGWFNRKKEQISELPDLPELPINNDFSLNEIHDIPELKINELPKLPNSNISDQNNIKNLIDTNMQKSRFEPLFTTEEEPKFDTKKYTKEITKKYENKSYVKEANPIFIRLDKFKQTSDTLEEMRRKLEEIDHSLKRIREIKSKEDQELTEWEKEIDIIKTKIDDIERNIFSKFDQ